MNDYTANDISLYTELNGELVSHFKLNEFANSQGFARIHPKTLRSLELTRHDLETHFAQQVYITITDATRTPQEQIALGLKLGWDDEGGLVSRDSRHQAKYGGIAVDFKAYYRNAHTIINQKDVGIIASKHFDYIKANYPDGHIHADNRES